MQDAHKKTKKKHTPPKAAAIRLTLLLFPMCTKPRTRYQNSAAKLTQQIASSNEASPKFGHANSNLNILLSLFISLEIGSLYGL